MFPLQRTSTQLVDKEEEKQADSRPARAGAAAFTCSLTVVLVGRNTEQDGYY